MEASRNYDESDCGHQVDDKRPNSAGLPGVGLSCTGVAAQRCTAAAISGGKTMKASVLYRIASVLLLLFAALHTLGFRQNVPEWGVGSVIDSMRSVHFDAQGFKLTYWEVFSAFGFFFSVFLLFAAVLAWQMGGLPAGTLAPFERHTAWALAISFAAVTVLNWRYAFTTPIVFSTLITVCLVAAAWLSARPTAR
jgi:hypothetical protein